MTLNLILCRRILDADHSRALDHEQITQMAEALELFIYRAIEKYVVGQREHGGNIIDRDLSLEIDHELIDLFWYHSANKRKQSIASHALDSVLAERKKLR